MSSSSSIAGAVRGDSLKLEGENALKRVTIFGFGKTQKYEDAAEAFKGSGNAYKLASLWQSAGDVFLKASDAYEMVDSANDSTNMIIEAAQCYRKVNSLDSVKAYRRAIGKYNDVGKFGQSARYCKEMAEVYEADNNKIDALAAYQEAADLFNSDNKKLTGNQCLVKVATLASEAGELMRAANIYEELGKESMQSRLGAYSAKGHFFQSLLCHLALGDTVQVSNKMDAFKNIDFSFGNSREGAFVEKLLEAFETMSVDDYGQACADFDRITPLDPWKTSMLLQAKKFISDVSGEGDDDDIDLS